MRGLVEVMHPDRGPGRPPEPGVLNAPESGVIFHIAHDRLVAAAAEADCLTEVVAPVGDFVPAGALIRVDPSGAPLRPDVLQYVGLGPEWTMNQDLAYGFKMFDVSPADRRPPLERPRRLLDRDAEEGDTAPDRQGIGRAPTSWSRWTPSRPAPRS